MVPSFLRGLSLFALLLTLVLPAWAQDSKGVGVVTALTGKADLKRPQAPQVPLRLRDDLFVRDVVDTQKESLARILLMGKSTVTVRELSRFEIREEVRPDGSQRALINLAAGKIRVMVARRLMKPGDEVQIRTPNALASVRGTDGIFEVTTLPDGRPQTVITGVSGEFQVTLPTTPPFITRGMEFLDGPAYAGGAPRLDSPAVALAELASDAGTGIRVAQLLGLSVTTGLQAQITGFAGAQALAQALLTQGQLNQAVQTFHINIGATGASQPPPAATDKVAAVGLSNAQSASLASGAQPGLTGGAGPQGVGGGGLVFTPPITPLTGKTQQLGATIANGVSVASFSGPVIASQTFSLSFSSAMDIKMFDVVATNATWFVSVQDCCIPGDKWKAAISYGGNTLTSVTGNGSTTVFSDPVGVTGTGTKTFVTKVSYTTGVDMFPAGMTTKFDTTKGSISVTQK